MPLSSFKELKPEHFTHVMFVRPDNSISVRFKMADDFSNTGLTAFGIKRALRSLLSPSKIAGLCSGEIPVIGRKGNTMPCVFELTDSWKGFSTSGFHFSIRHRDTDNNPAATGIIYLHGESKHAYFYHAPSPEADTGDSIRSVLPHTDKMSVESLLNGRTSHMPRITR